MMRELKIFSGRANPDLANEICQHLHLKPSAITLGKFPDGENYCKLDDDVRGRDVFLGPADLSTLQRQSDGTAHHD